MDNPYKETNYKGYTIKIYPDSSPEDPREWDNVCTMICFHPKYDLGDKHNFQKSNYHSWNELRESIEKGHKPVAISPLWLYDHSGITISCGNREYPYDCRWDSSQVGWIYVSKETAKKEWSRKTGQTMEKWAYGMIHAEVKTYDDYLTGNIYGYMVEDREGNDVGSCWGYFGIKECEKEALAVAKAAYEKAPDLPFREKIVEEKESA